MAPWGLTLDDVAGDPVDIWPEHERSVLLFVRVGTQWRTSMAGYYGLDYNVVISLLNRMGLDDVEFNDTMDNIRVMEQEALRVIREESK